MMLSKKTKSPAYFFAWVQIHRIKKEKAQKLMMVQLKIVPNIEKKLDYSYLLSLYGA